MKPVQRRMLSALFTRPQRDASHATHAGCECGRKRARKNAATPALSAFTAVCSLLLASGPAQALTIVPTFASSVSLTQQSAINTALNFYNQNFSDPVQVSIYFGIVSSASYAGQSYSTSYYSAYSSQNPHAFTYTGAMSSDAATYGNTIEQTAYNNLSYGNSASSVLATSADLRALGLSSATGGLTSSGGSGGSFDGVISINDNYFGTTVIQHEVNEVLGIGGAGSVLNYMYDNNLTSPPTGAKGTYIRPLDLFRYSAPGTASLTTDGNATSYFSIDGGASSIAGFNQNYKGDYGDWVSGSTCYVQDWQLCSNPQSISLNSPEGIALQAIGYDAVAPVPLPGSLILFASGIIGLGAARRRNARSTRV